MQNTFINMRKSTGTISTLNAYISMNNCRSSENNLATNHYSMAVLHNGHVGCVAGLESVEKV